ncbi:hypothetical protein KDW10_30550 [Burkholderia vietnamiensis]|uniref:hypothetical protein n=1 Tax=Burkholderia vietnamiensis TaxID=60552 RepID=UPI001B9BA42D|nr:hypothetical protein [Burkholderia vietnamiensis]MBR8361672.1 hypothetical protein [Burkholderia vietnamiensis]
MNDLKKQHEQAKAAYETARDELASARHAYEHGAGKTLAEAKKSRESIGAQLDSETQAGERAKTALSQAMLQSNGERTAEVKKALAERRDADDMIEQCSELLSESERLIAAAHIEASEAAKTYLGAYESAARRWAEMNVLAALVECGERIARAMAVKAPNADTSPLPSCEQLIIHGLRHIAEQGDERPYVQEIGSVDLGAMGIQDILSPIAIQRMKKEFSMETESSK